MNIGVFAMDPGGHTGLAWAILDPADPDGITGSLRNRMNSGSATIAGDERTQIAEIAAIWAAFYSACVRSALLKPSDVWFVCEDYIYAPGVNYSGESAAISTALIWGVEGYRMGRRDEWKEHNPRKTAAIPSMILQPAGVAMQFATNARLKEWDCWVVGRDHERSAFRHLAAFLSKYKTQYAT